MGIHGLMKLLSEECPEAIKEQEMENMTGRKVAVDASMAIYQFLIAVRSSGQGYNAALLTNEAGEVTSHIQGMFNRTIKMLSCGIKPAYVFDGKPPQMKSGELAKRTAKRAKAEQDLAAAKESGDVEEMDKFSRRLVKVTKQHNEDCKQLLRLMGVPVIDAPCEAEAQCAELAKKGKVYAAATEDMDTLTFRSPKLVRKLTFSQGSKEKQPIIEIDCESVLKGLGLSYEQFVDLCIMCGCDYCNSIKGIGPKTALKLIKQFGTIENVVNALKRNKKISIPIDWLPQRVRRIEEDSEKEEQPAEDSKETIETSNLDESTHSSSLDQQNQDQSSNNHVAEDNQTERDGEDVHENELDEDPFDKEGDDVDFDFAAVDSDDLNADGNHSSNNTNNNNEEEGEDDEYEIIPPVYIHARSLFLNSEVHPGEDLDLKWSEPQENELRQFLVEKMGFNADRVNSGIKRLQEAQQKKAQQRLDK